MMTKWTMVLACVCCFLLATFNATGQTIFNTPELAAQTLYTAWRTKNQVKARTVTGDEAVEKLFSVRRRPMRFMGCSKREAGDFECIYEDSKNDLTMAMLTTRVTRRGYRIRSLSFSSEAY